jgi:surfactin synthase thioesterase subunit
VRGRYSSGVVWPDPRPSAARVLVCFGFCGGSPTAFRPWLRSIPPDVDLALVCLPGRDRRAGEPPLAEWGALMREAVTSLRSVIDRPYVVCGHSMGAWVAFEATVALQDAGGPAPDALVVSASNAPSRSDLERRSSPDSGASDETLLAWLREVGQLPEIVLSEPGLRQLALDLFRADKRAAESYRFTAGTTVGCAVRHLCAENDPHVDPADEAWSELVTGPYRRDVLAGGHFYTDDIWASLPTFMGL